MTVPNLFQSFSALAAIDATLLNGLPQMAAPPGATLFDAGQPCAGFPGAAATGAGATGKYPDCVVLDLDYTVLMKLRG